MRLVELWRYPVKSLRGERLEHAELTATGIPGDRKWALQGPDVKPMVGPWASAKNYAQLLEAEARLIDGEPVITLPPGMETLSDLLGMDVTLHEKEGGHFDDKAVHLVTTGSLRGQDPRRFRPNLVIEGDGEQGWIGRRLQVGPAILRIVKPTRRCVMITHAQADLPRDPSLLKETGVIVGVYAAVEAPGQVLTGADCRLID